MAESTRTKGAKAKRPPSAARRVDEHVEGMVSSIGPRLRQLRQEQRLSLQQLAVRAEVSAAAIHKIERSDMVPTITTLLKISAALERPVSYFIEQGDGPPERATLTRAAKRPVVFTPHRGLSLAGISGAYSLFKGAAAVATVEPGADSGAKPMSHSGEELVFVTEGALVFDIAGSRFELGPGDSLHFIGDQPHHWANEGKKAAKAVWFALRDS
jgi:transcriptional regulator with XRE-family HTH domain